MPYDMISYLRVTGVLPHEGLDLIVFQERLPHDPEPLLPSPRRHPLQETRAECVRQRPPELVRLLSEGVRDAVLPRQVFQVVVFPGPSFDSARAITLHFILFQMLCAWGFQLRQEAYVQYVLLYDSSNAVVTLV